MAIKNIQRWVTVFVHVYKNQTFRVKHESIVQSVTFRKIESMIGFTNGEGGEGILDLCTVTTCTSFVQHIYIYTHTHKLQGYY